MPNANTVDSTESLTEFSQFSWFIFDGFSHIIPLHPGKYLHYSLQLENSKMSCHIFIALSNHQQDW